MSIKVIIVEDRPIINISVDEFASQRAVQAAKEAKESEEQTGLDRIATGEDRVQTGLDRVQTGLDRVATGADAIATGLDATQTGLDRVQTGLDRIATGEDRVATGLDRVQTGLDAGQTELDKIATGEDRIQTGLDRVATGEDRVQTGLDRVATGEDRIATGEDRIATGLDAIATAADRVQTGLDRIATGEDRTQTGLDRVATGADVLDTNADVVQTGLDKAATAADRVQTGLDRVQTGLDRIAAADSAASAAQVGTSTPLTGFSVGGNTAITSANTILSAFGKAQGQINERIGGTVEVGQVAFGTGTKVVGGDSGLVWDNTNKRLSVLGPNYPTLRTERTTTTEASTILQAFDLKLRTSLDMALNFGVGMTFTLQDNTATSIIGRLQFLRGTTDSLGRFQIIQGTAETIVLTTSEIGQVGIGITPTQTLDVNGTGRIRNGVSLADVSGNVQIGTTTDAGFRLDVNGTARVQGELTTNLTAGRVPFIGTGGVLSDSNALTFDQNLTQLTVGGTTTSLRILSNQDNYLFNLANPLIYTTNNTVNFPGATNLGSLIIQARSSSGAGARDVIIAYSDGTQQRVHTVFERTGNLVIGLNELGTEKLDVNGRTRIRTIDNATGNFLTTSATGVIQQRTALQSITDMGATISNWNAAVRQRLEHTTAGILEWVNV